MKLLFSVFILFSCDLKQQDHSLQSDDAEGRNNSAKSTYSTEVIISEHLKQHTYRAITSEFRLDTATIAKLMDENFISIYPHKIQSKQQELTGIYKSEINRRKDAHLVDSLYLDDFKVQLFDNTAVATYYSVTKGTKNGVPFDNDRMRWYDVWVKRNGKWKWVSSQGTWVSKE